MKKVIALLSAAVMILSFAACSGGKQEQNKVPEEIATQATPEETSAEEATEEITTEVETTEAETTTEPVTEKEDGLTSEDISEVVKFYVDAYNKTNEAGKTPGKQTMALVEGSLNGDGPIGKILKVVEPVARKALAKNSIDTDCIPGHGLLEDDVKSASAVSENGKTKIRIKVKQQVDGCNADGENGGPVARGIGTLGSIEIALNEMGAKMVTDGDSVKLTYNDAYIDCVVDNESGKIISGKWHHMVNIYVGEEKAKIGLTATLKNFTGQVEYVVSI